MFKNLFKKKATKNIVIGEAPGLFEPGTFKNQKLRIASTYQPIKRVGYNEIFGHTPGHCPCAECDALMSQIVAFKGSI